MLADKLRSATAAEKLFVDDLFVSWLRTGTGASGTITTNIDMTKGYMLWSKGRSGATDHAVYHSARGVTLDLVTNSTAGQTTQSQGLTAVSATGHTIGTLAKMNTNGATYVDWVVRNGPKFYNHAVVTKSSGSNATISFPDLATLGMVRVKRTDAAGSWHIWHRSLSAGQLLIGETTAAAATLGHVTVSGTTVTLVNGVIADGTYLVEAFAHDTAADGLIQCESFGDASASDVSVTLGWEPQFVLWKPNAATNWRMADVMRSMSVGGGTFLLTPNNSSAEITGAQFIVPTSTGFVVKAGTVPAGSSQNIYIAIRRPNKPPTSGTQVFAPISSNAAQGTKQTTNFVVDMQMQFLRGTNVSDNTSVVDRIRGVSSNSSGLANRVVTSSTAAEVTGATPALTQGFDNTGFQIPQNWASSNTLYLNFRRAPGFHDQICYTGTGANKTEAHNLGVQPQLWLAKRRNRAGSWTIGSTLLNNTEKIVMPSPNGRVTDATAWNSTFPTATNISLGTQADVNVSGDTYALWMWATLPGISSVFTYTGNGTSQTVNCGFSTGARFVMIIRVTASTAQDIFIWDTARGIVAGNDPQLSLSTTAAEVTTLDTIDTDSTGFIVNTDSSNVNVNGAVYIGLAIS